MVLALCCHFDHVELHWARRLAYMIKVGSTRLPFAWPYTVIKLYMLNKQCSTFVIRRWFCRRTFKRNLLPIALVQEGTDRLWCGIAQDCVQHCLAEPADHKLALVFVRVRQDPADLLQQVDDSFLRGGKKKVEGVTVRFLHQLALLNVSSQCQTSRTSVLSLGRNLSRVLIRKRQKEQWLEGWSN